jgi:hypothetical protein
MTICPEAGLRGAPVQALFETVLSVAVNVWTVPTALVDVSGSTSTHALPGWLAAAGAATRTPVAMTTRANNEKTLARWMLNVTPSLSSDSSTNPGAPSRFRQPLSLGYIDAAFKASGNGGVHDLGT